MNTCRNVFFIILLSCFFHACKGQAVGTAESSENLQIFLLIGQSNMAGRAEIEKQDMDTLENVYLYSGSGWEKAGNPLNKYSTIRKDLQFQKLGPGYTFAREMAENLQNQNVGLVVNVRGGTAISEWMPGTHFYNEAVNRTKAALKNGMLRGILWHQGESNIEDTATYMGDLEVLIGSLRSDFNMPALPFVAGQLSEDKPARAGFNNMIIQLPDKVSSTAVATSMGLSTFDDTHFDSESQRELGRRYALEMLKLIQPDRTVEDHRK